MLCYVCFGGRRGSGCWEGRCSRLASAPSRPPSPSSVTPQEPNSQPPDPRALHADRASRWHLPGMAPSSYGSTFLLWHHLPIMAGAISANFFANGAFNIAYIQVPELYPTSVRNTALGQCARRIRESDRARERASARASDRSTERASDRPSGYLQVLGRRPPRRRHRHTAAPHHRPDRHGHRGRTHSNLPPKSRSAALRRISQHRGVSLYRGMALQVVAIFVATAAVIGWFELPETARDRDHRTSRTTSLITARCSLLAAYHSCRTPARAYTSLIWHSDL